METPCSNLNPSCLSHLGTMIPYDRNKCNGNAWARTSLQQPFSSIVTAKKQKNRLAILPKYVKIYMCALQSCAASLCNGRIRKEVGQFPIGNPYPHNNKPK